MLALAASPAARTQNPSDHEISAIGNGQVVSRPDLGILVLKIQTTAPLAADAATQCARKAGEIRTALAGMGYASGSFELTPMVFSPAGGPYYSLNQPTVTAISAQQFLFVFFEGSVLADTSQLNQKVATTIDALNKSGAGPANPYPQQQAAMVVYTVKDPASYETQALAKALEAARQKANVIAKNLGVELTGLRTASSTFPEYAGVARAVIGAYGQMPTNPLEDLPYRFYSIRPDQVVVTSSATLVYSFK